MAKPRSQRTKPFKKPILIYCPGEIEQGYLYALKDDRYRGSGIVIKPKLGHADNFTEVFKDIVKDYADGESIAYFYVNDMDAIIAQDMLEKYQKAKGKAMKATQGMLAMIETMPCIEYWFLLHNRYTTKYYSSYESMKKDVRDAIPDYDKNEAWARKIYGILKDRIDIAIERAIMSMDNLRKGEGACSYTNMHELIEQLDALLVEKKG